jgi:hypothetical protein
MGWEGNREEWRGREGKKREGKREVRGREGKEVFSVSNTKLSKKTTAAKLSMGCVLEIRRGKKKRGKKREERKRKERRVERREERRAEESRGEQRRAEENRGEERRGEQRRGKTGEREVPQQLRWSEAWVQIFEFAY